MLPSPSRIQHNISRHPNQLRRIVDLVSRGGGHANSLQLVRVRIDTALSRGLLGFFVGAVGADAEDGVDVDWGFWAGWLDCC